jgi:hypothetical protein
MWSICRPRYDCDNISRYTSRYTFGSVMDQKEKTREIRLRRMAERQGLKLHKSRRRDPRALEYGGHWLVNEKGKVRVGGRNGATLDTIEAFLTGRR